MLLNISNNLIDNYSYRIMSTVRSRVTVSLKYAKKNVISATIAFLDRVSYHRFNVKKERTCTFYLCTFAYYVLNFSYRTYQEKAHDLLKFHLCKIAIIVNISEKHLCLSRLKKFLSEKYENY